jgi:ABC-type Fe3+-citrate transport system substrate-binding protein
MSYQESIETGRRAAEAINKLDSGDANVAAFKRHIQDFGVWLARDQEYIKFASCDDARAVADMVDVLMACAHFTINPE